MCTPTSSHATSHTYFPHQVTLTFCTYLLATHPDVEEKVRQEFERVLGPPGSPITLEQVKECRYTKWVLQETLRLFPPVPGDGFETTAETVLPGNYRVPQGVRVRACVLFVAVSTPPRRRGRMCVG